MRLTMKKSKKTSRLHSFIILFGRKKYVLLPYPCSKFNKFNLAIYIYSVAGTPSGRLHEPHPPHAGDLQWKRSCINSIRSSRSENSICGANIYSIFSSNMLHPWWKHHKRFWRKKQKQFTKRTLTVWKIPILTSEGVRTPLQFHAAI